MSDAFNDQQLCLALRVECESWRGTPFRACSVAKGGRGGVDCAGFVGAVFHAIGLITDQISVPPYAINYAEHSEESLLRAWFDRPEVRSIVRRVETDEPLMDGDIVFPVVGRCEHHMGIISRGEIYHVARGSGVCNQTLSQLKLAASRYRLRAQSSCRS